MKTFSWFVLVLLCISVNANGESIDSIVEFFSFNCIHCANVDGKLESFIATHKIQYLDINIDNGPDALATTVMYYLAVDAGVGPQFKSVYFKAIANGMPVYDRNTLNMVVKQISNLNLLRLANSKKEQERIKQKMNYAISLIASKHIQVTPTFLINNTILLSGEDVINSILSRTIKKYRPDGLGENR